MRKGILFALVCLAWTFGGSQMGGCGSSSTPFVPQVASVVVVNTADTFTVTLVGFGYSGTVDRMWSCSAAQAKLTLGSSMVGGSVHIVIQDNGGGTVYDNVHSNTMGGLTVQTKPGGAPGTWHVVMSFSGATWTGAVVLDADTLPAPDAVSIGSGIGGSDTYIFHGGWNATGGTPIQVTVATGITGGSVRIRLWDPATPTTSPAPFDQTVNVGTPTLNGSITTGGAGTWTVQIDFSSCVLGGAISITN
jgi:hypothetical protein